MKSKYTPALLLPIFSGCMGLTEPINENACQTYCTAVLQNYADRPLPTRVRDNVDSTGRTIETDAETLSVSGLTYQRKTIYIIRTVTRDTGDSIFIPFIGLSDGQVNHNGDSLFLFQRDGFLSRRGTQEGDLLNMLDHTDTLATYRVIKEDSTYLQFSAMNNPEYLILEDEEGKIISSVPLSREEICLPAKRSLPQSDLVNRVCRNSNRNFTSHRRRR